MHRVRLFLAGNQIQKRKPLDTQNGYSDGQRAARFLSKPRTSVWLVQRDNDRKNLGKSVNLGRSLNVGEAVKLDEQISKVGKAKVNLKVDWMLL